MTRTVRANPIMGWEPDEDARDSAFPMALVLEVSPPVAPLPVELYYQTGPILNQGQFPMCVGYSWRQWLTTGTVQNTDPDPAARTIYCEARTRDPWAGDCTTDLRSGTSIRAAAQYLQSRGLITTYVWAWNAETIRQWILSGRGPVVAGTRWYRSMMRTVAGRLVVNVSSGLAGGHAYAITGYSDKTKLFRVTNSWGAGWGQGGHAYLRSTDLDLLLGQQGECVTATELDRDVFVPANAPVTDALEPPEENEID